MAIGVHRWLIVGAALGAALAAPILAAESPPVPAPVRAAEAPAAPAPAAVPEAPKPPTPQEREQMVALVKAALGPDPAASAKAVDDLAALGEPARPRLAAAVGELLARDRAAIGGTARRLGAPDKVKALTDEIAGVRAAALANIAQLDKGDKMKLAHEHYDQLARLQPTFNKVYAVRDAVRAAVARRPRLLAMWKECGPPGDAKFSPAVEEKLLSDAAAVLGMTIEKAVALPDFGKDKEPADPLERHCWFYAACRRIEAHNRGLERLLSAAELENITLLNAYRESLGTLPLEIDARLIQSARRHSKEMVDLGYFAHESPTASEKSHTQRMKNAGYSSGYSENIAYGMASGRGAFQMWFESPPHHQNMVHAESTAMGVGAWGPKWTQNFGTGRRLMFLEPAERAKEVVQGPILGPQGGPAGGGRYQPPP